MTREVSEALGRDRRSNRSVWTADDVLQILDLRLTVRISRRAWFGLPSADLDLTPEVRDDYAAYIPSSD